MSSILELLKNKKQSLDANRRAKTAKPGDGRSRWRILPGWRKPDADNAEQFWHDFGQHFIKNQAGELKAVYVCVDKTFGKPCEVCSTVSSAIGKAHDEEQKTLLKDSNANGRVLLNALHVDGDSPNDPAILEIPPSVFRSMIGIIDEWGLDVLDLADGKDFVIERSGKGLLTKYTVQVAAKSAPVDPSIMKRIANLDEYVAQESEEQMTRALSNFRQIAGLLPSGVSSGAGVSSYLSAPAPATGLAAMKLDEADEAAIDAAMATPYVAPAVAAPVASAPVAAPAAAAAGADAELDALLASLG